MSRLIIKNLPSGIKEERLKTLFSKHGQVTDCCLKFTKDGKFRKFAFVGFAHTEEATAAIKHFNGTFLDTSKIQVEVAKNLSDASKPRAWSKYSKESSAYQKLHATKEQSEKGDKKKKNEKERKKSAKDKAVDEMLGDLKDDPEFDEFLKAHQRAGRKTIWDNDTVRTVDEKVKVKGDGEEDEDSSSENNSNEDTDSNEDNSDDKESDDDVSEGDSGVNSEDDTQRDKSKKSPKKILSDLEYLKSKMTDKTLLSDSDDEVEEETKVKNDDIEEDSDSDDDDEEENDSDDDEGEDSSEEMTTKYPENQKKKHCVLKMKGLQFNTGDKSVKEFFKPLVVTGIKIPRNAKKKPIGIAFVSFADEKDLDQAMRRNKNFIGGKRIFLKKCTQEETKESGLIEKTRPWELKTDVAVEDESIAESGRIYVRNLAYSCTEEDLQKLFEKFGPVAEVHLPVDTLTRKIKGFAFVTYMMPEHAVKAFSQLDGTTFMGRLLHLLPAKEKKDDVTETNEGSSYKTKKQAKQKAMASSTHNWNTMFLGANAVVDALASKYGTSKSDILDPESKQSLGVRMALGETQLVAETRDFLLENGVALDAFSQPSAARSKSVILVKNLSAGTKAEDLRELFSKYGSVGRVVLPPSGITAIVEYLEQTEAKSGFRNLAYTKFQHLPLYLEWAPMEVFKPAVERSDKEESMDTSQDQQKEHKSDDKEDESGDEESESEETEPGSILFVKNLSFDTTEESLQKIFKKCGEIRSVSIAKKKDMKKPGTFLSMGYGFVEYRHKKGADKALKELQHIKLDDHALELKISNREVVKPQSKSNKKKTKKAKQTSSKILVRNIPFEATRKELFELFRVFGELKTVRLPKKLSGTGSHRGFGFVDFLTKQDAKRAFDALCHSTHLFGRRLVLEWAESAEDIEELRKKTAEHFHDDVPSKKTKKSAIMETLQSSV